ncbi:MAG: hypothetical protein NXI31_02825 [bacterium]|nr:hypothetical protein [bacterium]
MSQRFPLFLFPVALALTTSVSAQCQPSWNNLAQLGFGVSGQVRALLPWDPDGAGPQQEVIVVAGGFQEAGGIPAANVALYDPVSGAWAPLGAGTDNTINALAVDGNGDLLVGGAFLNAGGVTSNGIARWNGTAWQPIGVGFDVSQPGVSVRSLAVGGNGEIYAGGDFTMSGGNALSYFAQWNGATWQQAGAGLAFNLGCAQTRFGVLSLIVRPNGDVLAGGQFELVANPAVRHYALWDGTSWQAVPGAPAFDCVQGAALLTSGDVVVAGTTASGGTVVSWDGTSWQTLGSPGGRPNAVAELGDGSLVIARNGSLPQGPAVARWDGANWSTMATFTLQQAAFAVVGLPGSGSTALMAGGNFSTYGPPTGNARSLIRWDGNTWTGSPGGTIGIAYGFDVLPNGDVVAAGSFSQIGGVAANNVARWNGTTWIPIGNNAPSPCYGVATTDAGEIYVAAFNQVLQWTGSSWRQISSDNAWGILTRQNGKVTAWDDAVREWDGTSWSELPGAVNIDEVVEAPNGDLLALGGNSSSFWPLQGRIGRWDGLLWHSLDPTFQAGQAEHIAAGPNGSVLVAWTPNVFPNPQPVIMEYDGVNWRSIGSAFNAEIYDLMTLPNGDCLALGAFTTTGGSPNSAFAARWDGQTWHDVAGSPGQPVWHAVVRPTGELFAEIQVGSFFDREYAIATSPCLPNASALGSGCPGSGGANRLLAVTWPQIGVYYRGRGSELPTNSLVFDVIGLQTTNIALNTLTPLAPAGCVDHVTPLANRLLVPIDGRATREVDLPLDPGLIGVDFHHQMFPVELDGQGNPVAVTATNAVSVRIGSVL